MDFKDFRDLVNKINHSLGSFCNTFQYRRKELMLASGASDSGRIFGNIKAEHGWAINKGGGTQIQYHIAFSTNTKEVRYGLGFNTQYVPHANEMSTVEYIKPFMDSFIANKQKIKAILPDYDYVIGDEGMLTNPVHNEYVLFGRKRQAHFNGQNYVLSDLDYDTIITDLKKQLEAFEIVFNGRSQKNKIIEKYREVLDVIKYKKQLIFQGPPGTGKTREAKDIAELMIFNEISSDKSIQTKRLKESDQFKLVQFHPSYTYEDFIRGIVAKPNPNGNGVIYEAEDKTLIIFAKEAIENYNDSKKTPEQISKERWVRNSYQSFKESLISVLEEADEIIIKDGTKPKIKAIEEDSIRVNRYSNAKDSILVKDFDIINGYIGSHLSQPVIKIRENTLLSKSARSGMYYLYQNLIEKFKKYLDDKELTFEAAENSLNVELKEYILIIDEINRANLSSVLGELIYALEYRGETVESMYEVGSRELVLPPNLYIVGTMNTADRSVGHIDYAIRRRFAFLNILPEDLSKVGVAEFNQPLFKTVSELFLRNYEEYFNFNELPQRAATLSPEFRPEDVWLGHSYFIDNSAKGGDIITRLEYEIKPILLEYVKDGILIGKVNNQNIEDYIKTL